MVELSPQKKTRKKSIHKKDLVEINEVKSLINNDPNEKKILQQDITTGEENVVNIATGKQVQTKKKGSSRKKTSAKSRTISITDDVFNALENYKTEIQGNFGGKLTNSMLIRSLLNDHVDLENVRKEMEQIKQEAEETQEYIKEILKLAVSSSGVHSPIIYSQMPGSPYPPQPSYLPNAPFGSPMISPPSPPKFPPRPDYKPTNTANLRADYANEIKQIFTGEIMSPSQVLNITQPKHKDSKIEPLKEDTLVPDVSQISYVEKFKEYFAEKPKEDETPKPSNSLENSQENE